MKAYPLWLNNGKVEEKNPHNKFNDVNTICPIKKKKAAFAACHYLIILRVFVGRNICS